MSSERVIAAIVPCYNEELAVGTVVRDLIAAVPGIVVYVYDNNSTDQTRRVAEDAGAIVRLETAQGKGSVVRRAFADVEADVYVMIDGDDTYSVDALPGMIDTLLDGPYDHVLGVRREVSDTAYRPGHALGNRGFNYLTGSVFGNQVSDMLSGYRVMSRRFVKSFPALSREFEIETELTVHAMSLRVPQTEVEVGFKDRPEGSESKLRTYHDGFRILRLIGQLIRHERPMLFFGWIAAAMTVIGIILGIPVVLDYLDTGEVLRIPTVSLTITALILGALAFAIGLVLDGVLRSRREHGRLIYLLHSPPR